MRHFTIALARSSLALVSLALCSLGCGGASEPEPAVQTLSSTSGGSGNQQDRPPPLAPVAQSAPAGADSAFQSGVGRDREHPVPTCGAMESYAYVAGTFQCPGGGNPLGGDPLAGQRARIGNVGAHAGGSSSPLDAHIVDEYEVPCPAGPRRVYVCLYHCAPGRSPYDS